MLILFGDTTKCKVCAFYIKKTDGQFLLRTVTFSPIHACFSTNPVTQRKNNGKFCDCLVTFIKSMYVNYRTTIT